jgi:GNAT superfamily N-acetyltransferase
MARRLRPLTAARVADLPLVCGDCAFWDADLATLGACGGASETDRLRAWVREVSDDWGDCGRIVYVDGQAVGFARYAPARYFPQTSRMPAGAPSPDAVVLACLHVSADVRDAGLGKVLVQAVLRDVVSRGERAIEAYGAAAELDRERSPLMSVESLIKQGFTVIRPHSRFPLMRLELRTLAAWTESIETVLESLQVPVLRRERIPSPVGSR